MKYLRVSQHFLSFSANKLPDSWEAAEAMADMNVSMRTVLGEVKTFAAATTRALGDTQAAGAEATSMLADGQRLLRDDLATYKAQLDAAIELGLGGE